MFAVRRTADRPYAEQLAVGGVAMRGIRNAFEPDSRAQPLAAVSYRQSRSSYRLGRSLRRGLGRFRGLARKRTLAKRYHRNRLSWHHVQPPDSLRVTENFQFAAVESYLSCHYQV